MARLARLVVPGLPHHVTQRGNRGQKVFFTEGDYAAYRSLVAEACESNEVRCLAWCLMPNHVHLILVPNDPDGLRATLAEAHRRYSRAVNASHGWTGYLWQGRFASYAMDEAHLMVAIRYVELNPVKAKLVGSAEDWAWSSARAHVEARSDGLTDLMALTGIARNWKAMLRLGLDAGEMDEAAAAAMEAHQRTGRPWGNSEFLEKLEAQTGRALRRRKPGRKPRTTS